ncbi:hypothetical protein [Saccharothrix obliqua]|uniref:hypothetical protein n=1 Tax=Saccharothrix obliqua TaxID=2861747 RepID=UPI001C5D1027|nr:hypothetical protein [Saccharothrix obliqua]MBW4720195.1 hypothetical protein [Saccharothrix obliqua]
MTALLCVLAVVALVVLGLERNHRRLRDPWPAGSSDVHDRDAGRLEHELHAAAVNAEQVRGSVWVRARRRAVSEAA